MTIVTLNLDSQYGACLWARTCQAAEASAALLCTEAISILQITLETHMQPHTNTHLNPGVKVAQ